MVASHIWHRESARWYLGTQVHGREPKRILDDFLHGL